MSRPSRPARVYLPRLDAWQVGADVEPELAARERRELFVAMTRARDGLWCCRVVADVVASVVEGVGQP